MTTAILLIAHGSRRPEANADLVEVARMLGLRLPDHFIEIAYLELTEPTIPQGLERCRQRGANQIRMLPYFLSAGSHVTRDLEAYRQGFRGEHPEILCELCPPLGLHPKLIDVLVERVQRSPDLAACDSEQSSESRR